MSRACVILGVLLFCVVPANPVAAEIDDLGRVIEGFVAKQFPDAASHFWVVNQTEQGAADEVVVDLNTVVVLHKDQPPTEQRFLLLIVDGKLRATQSIPLGIKVECTPGELV